MFTSVSVGFKKFNMYPLECYAPYYVKFGMDQREICKFLNYR